jgi:hypothetical protein
MADFTLSDQTTVCTTVDTFDVCPGSTPVSIFDNNKFFSLIAQVTACHSFTNFAVCPGSTPTAFIATRRNFSLPQSSVCLDYTIQGAGGGAPQLPTTGQIWPQGMYLGTYS